MNFLLWSKAKLVAVGAIFLSVVGFFLRLKYVENQRDRLKRDAETYKAQLHQKRLIEEADSEIESDYSDQQREAQKDLRDGEIPSHLENPDQW